MINYIITVHNKENLIYDVLCGIGLCASSKSEITVVLDGCTDKSELHVDEFIRNNNFIKVNKIYCDDLHEILSINRAISKINLKHFSYLVILQDDVILQQPNLEHLIDKLALKLGDKMGYVSLRHGANIDVSKFLSSSINPYKQAIENVFGHGLDHPEAAIPGRFYCRDIGIKSPVCIPTKVIETIGLMDEKLAPCFLDDLDYSLRCKSFGYQNGVFPIRYRSDVDWGTTRQSKRNYQSIIERNHKYLKEKHENLANSMGDTNKNDEIEIAPVIDTQLEYYDIIWHENKKILERSRIKKTALFCRIFKHAT